MIIAIDGPAGSGKSSVAKALADRLGFFYLDTGAMYRAMTYKVIKDDIGVNNIKKLEDTAANLDLNLVETVNGVQVFLDGQDVTKEIRSQNVTDSIKDIANVPEVREKIVAKQRELARSRNCILEGRDIGTVVFPDADIKFYLDASFQERVRRRFDQKKKQGDSISIDVLEKSLAGRDSADKSRPVGALRKAEDAFYVDTTDMTEKEVVEFLYNKVNTIIDNG